MGILGPADGGGCQMGFGEDIKVVWALLGGLGGIVERSFIPVDGMGA